MVSYNDFINSLGQANALYGSGGYDESGAPLKSPFSSDPNEELRRRFNLPSSVSNQQIQQYFQANGLPDAQDSGGLWQQTKDFAGPGSPLAWMASMIFGGPVAGSIAAANGSGATDSMGGKNTAQIASLVGTAYGNGDGSSFGSTPDSYTAGSEYGAPPPSSDGGAFDMGQGMQGTYNYQSPQNADFWNNTYAANNTGTITDATNGAPPAGEPGMWDWLDNLGGDTFSTNPSFTDLGGNIDPNTGFPRTGMEVAPGGAMDQFGAVASPNTLGTQGNIGDSFSPNLLDTLKQYGSQGLQIFKAIQSLKNGGSASTGSSGAAPQSAGGSILDQILGNPGQAAFNASPFLLSAYMANKQSGDLNGVLDSINGDAYTKSVLNPYDRDTGIGRANLLEDQNLRGVSGSSFGQGALDNYDYTRSMGRSDMASKASLAAAGVKGSLINQRNTNTNLLLGAGLGASGSLFKPQTDPFNLKALLGIT